MTLKQFCTLACISILASDVMADIYVNGQQMRPINPNHDEMMHRAAECGAYHIRSEGGVDPIKMKKILKVLNDYGVTKKEYNATVLSNLEYLGKLESGEIRPQYSYQVPTVNEILNKWKSKCGSVELYEELSR